MLATLFLACWCIVQGEINVAVTSDGDTVTGAAGEIEITADELQILHDAVSSSQTDIVRLLLEPCAVSGASLDLIGHRGLNALHLCALENDDTTIATLLLGCGASPVARTADDHQASFLHIAVSRMSGEGSTAFLVAVLDTITSMLPESEVEAVLDGVNYDGHTPLAVASWSEAHAGRVVQLLLDAGASIDVRNPITGDSALHYASRHGNMHALRVLLENGADPLAVDHLGVQAAQMARWHNHSEIAVELKEKPRRGGEEGAFGHDDSAADAAEANAASPLACDRPPNQTPFLGTPGAITSTFQRARASFPELEPTVLSETPWVMSFDRFLSEQESDALADVCGHHFQRSVHDAANGALAAVRSSAQCWFQPRAGCSKNSRCRVDPILERVLERIAEVTGSPRQNIGSAQVLQYGEGDYYATHHDQTHFVEPALPEGARVLTFFIYLSDVEAGGETRFPDLDLSITPRRGRALLWPSVMDLEPNTTDLHTFHEARPVVTGVKHAANVWVHQFDFQTPRTRRRCAMSSYAENSTDPRWEACVHRPHTAPPGRCQRDGGGDH